MASESFNQDLARVLETALGLVTGDRAHQHGDAHFQFSSIAEFWTVYLANRGLMDADRVLEDHDVAQMMVLLKVSRAMIGSFKADDYIDQTGYSALTYALKNRIPG